MRQHTGVACWQFGQESCARAANLRRQYLTGSSSVAGRASGTKHAAVVADRPMCIGQRDRYRRDQSMMRQIIGAVLLMLVGMGSQPLLAEENSGQQANSGATQVSSNDQQTSGTNQSQAQSGP